MINKIITLAIACASLALCGCSSTANLGTDLANFVSAIPVNTVTDASLQVQTPFWSHQLSATGLSKSKDGTIQIVNLKDNFAIPLWGSTKQFSVSGVTIESGTAPIALPAATVTVK